MFPNQGHSNDEAKFKYVLAFSAASLTPDEVVAELNNLGVEVIAIFDKFPNGKPRRLKWIEVLIDASQIQLLRKVYFERFPEGWYLVPASEWYKEQPRPILFSKDQTSFVNIENCAQLFL